MLSESASLPVVIIYERHWDEAPKQVLKNLIPKLAAEGYDTFCLEASQNFSENEIISSCQEYIQIASKITAESEIYMKNVGCIEKLSDISFEKLSELIRLYVSSKQYIYGAEKIKNLPACLLMKDIFNVAQKFSFFINGIDIISKDFNVISETDLTLRWNVIKNNESYRIENFTSNLVKLQKERKGIVFIGGAVHARNLMDKFIEKNMQNKVLFYFPHSTKNYDDCLDDVKELNENTFGILKGHTYCIINENDCKSLINRIIKEIKANNTCYQGEILEGNSQSVYLSKLFNENVKAFLRPGYYVDALIETQNVKDIKKIERQLEEQYIQKHHISMVEHTYLVIPEINTKQVEDRILRLK